MQFEWHEAKNQANIRKHGVSFEIARLIFGGPVLTRLDNRKDYGEDRYISIGKLEETLIVVAHTRRKGCIRIISARPASRKERRKYDGQIQ